MLLYTQVSPDLHISPAMPPHIWPSPRPAGAEDAAGAAALCDAAGASADPAGCVAAGAGGIVALEAGAAAGTDLPHPTTSAHSAAMPIHLPALLMPRAYAQMHRLAQALSRAVR